MKLYIHDGQAVEKGTPAEVLAAKRWFTPFARLTNRGVAPNAAAKGYDESR